MATKIFPQTNKPKTKMQNLQFRLRCSKTKQIIGFERLTLDGWQFKYYDLDWQDGTFHNSLMGDGYLGVVLREFDTGPTIDNILKWSIKNNAGEIFTFNTDDNDRASFSVVFDNAPAACRSVAINSTNVSLKN